MPAPLPVGGGNPERRRRLDPEYTSAKRQRRILLSEFLSRGAGIERQDDRVQGHTSSGDSRNSARIHLDRHELRGNQESHGATLLYPAGPCLDRANVTIWTAPA